MSSQRLTILGCLLSALVANTAAAGPLIGHPSALNAADRAVVERWKERIQYNQYDRDL
jgi:hypothetical protein